MTKLAIEAPLNDMKGTLGTKSTEKHRLYIQCVLSNDVRDEEFQIEVAQTKWEYVYHERREKRNGPLVL